MDKCVKRSENSDYSQTVVVVNFVTNKKAKAVAFFEDLLWCLLT